MMWIDVFSFQFFMNIIQPRKNNSLADAFYSDLMKIFKYM